MKLFPKLMLTALVLAVLLPFAILKKSDGTTMLSFKDFKWPDFLSAGIPDMPSADGITGDRVVAIYQWQDSQGNIQFTNEPPPQGIEFEVKHYDTNANVIQSVRLPSEEPEVPVVTAEPMASGTVEAPSPYSPESVKQMMDDAQEIQNLLNERFEKQQSAINQ